MIKWTKNKNFQRGLIAFCWIFGTVFSMKYLIQYGPRVGAYFVLVVLAWILLEFMVIYLVLASEKWHVFFAIVQEGTGIFVLRGGTVHRFIVYRRGYVLDKDWNIVEGQSRKRVLGLTFFFWPWEDVAVVRLPKTSLSAEGEVKNVITEWQHVTHIPIKDQVLFIKISQIEDKEKVPLDIVFNIRYRFCNPYKTFFVVREWLTALIQELENQTKIVIPQESYSKFWNISRQVLLNRIKAELNEIKTLDGKTPLDVIKDRYGIELLEIGIHALDPTRPEDREVMLMRFRAERQAEAAEAIRKKIETEALGERKRLELIGEIVESPQRLAAYLLMQVGKHPELAKAILVNLPSSLAPLVANAFGTTPSQLVDIIKELVKSEKEAAEYLRSMKEFLEKTIKKKGGEVNERVN